MIFYLALRKSHLGVLWSRGVHICVVVLFEFRITELHGLLKFFVVDHCGHLLGCLNGFHQRRTHNLVLADGDDW